jgi:Zn-dependent M28 family amino/carboxypeptidase
VVFAGYGIVAPEYGWNDYARANVAGKLVIVFDGEPSRPAPGDPAKADANFFKGDTRTFYSTRDFKYHQAARRGAAGILVVCDPSAGRTYSTFQTLAKLEGVALSAPQRKAPIISGLLTMDAARRVAAFAGHDFGRLAASASDPHRRLAIMNATASLSTKSTTRSIVSHNVVGRVEGSDPRLKREYVVYSAHWDHLGTDRTLEGDQIYNGAIDDAVGVAQLIEIARAFAALPRKPRRSILFIATTGEEKGHLGSRFYTERPLFPLARTVANINLDGGNVWGVTSDLISSGYGLSTLDEVLAGAAAANGRTFIDEAIDDGSLFFSSDQIEFAKAGIPAVFPFSGNNYVGKPAELGVTRWTAYGERDYHQVSDEIRPDWDLSGAVEDARWLTIASYRVAEADARPQWKPGSEFGRK